MLDQRVAAFDPITVVPIFDRATIPFEIAELGGVDMTSSGPMQDVVTLFGSLMDQVEGLLD